MAGKNTGEEGGCRFRAAPHHLLFSRPDFFRELFPAEDALLHQQIDKSAQY
jgi:hypothetical protein